MTKNVEYSVAEGVATIRLNRPDAMNAVDAETAKQLAQYARNAELDSAVRCVVLEGAGRNFSGGGDVKVFGTTMAMNDEDRRSVYAEILVHTHALSRSKRCGGRHRARSDRGVRHGDRCGRCVLLSGILPHRH